MNNLKTFEEYKPGIGKELLNSNMFQYYAIIKNRKWIKMIKYIFHDMLYKQRGIRINEEDPYGEENWDDNDIQNDQEMKDLLLNFFKEFLQETKTSKTKIDQIIEEIQNGEYKIKDAIMLLKVLYHLYLKFELPSKMAFYKKDEDTLFPWFFITNAFKITSFGRRRIREDFLE